MRSDQIKWQHSNKYSADSACLHCGGVIRHTSWCVRQNPGVRYAYQAVLGATELTVQDQLILHALGVAWTATDAPLKCSGACGKQTAE
jgi:hypothetical protein